MVFCDPDDPLDLLSRPKGTCNCKEASFRMKANKKIHSLRLAPEVKAAE